jgi:hypothetical protein
MAGICRADNAGFLPVGLGMKFECTLFVLGSQYVLFFQGVLACFDPWWPDLKLAVAYFD